MMHVLNSNETNEYIKTFGFHLAFTTLLPMPFCLKKNAAERKYFTDEKYKFAAEKYNFPT